MTLPPYQRKGYGKFLIAFCKFYYVLLISPSNDCCWDMYIFLFHSCLPFCFYAVMPWSFCVVIFRFLCLMWLSNFWFIFCFIPGIWLSVLFHFPVSPFKSLCCLSDHSPLAAFWFMIPDYNGSMHKFLELTKALNMNIYAICCMPRFLLQNEIMITCYFDQHMSSQRRRAKWGHQSGHYLT